MYLFFLVWVKLSKKAKLVEDSLVLVGFSVLARYFKQKHQDNLPKSKKCMAENPSHKLSSLPIATTRENTSKLYVAYKNSLKFWDKFKVHCPTFKLSCLINIPSPPPQTPKEHIIIEQKLKV